MTTRHKYLWICTSTFLAALTAAAILWNIARQEVYYLCGNFASGVDESSVIRQLNTANLSSYEQGLTSAGSKIEFSSRYNFHIHRCVIEFDEHDKVASAEYR